MNDSEYLINARRLWHFDMINSPFQKVILVSSLLFAPTIAPVTLTPFLFSFTRCRVWCRALKTRPKACSATTGVRYSRRTTEPSAPTSTSQTPARWDRQISDSVRRDADNSDSVRRARDNSDNVSHATDSSHNVRRVAYISENVRRVTDNADKQTIQTMWNG